MNNVLRLSSTSGITSTPGRLKLVLAAGWFFALLLFALTAFSAHQRYLSVKTVGVDAAPSVVASQRIKIAIASLDTNIVNELLAKPGAAPETITEFEKWRLQIAEQLVIAAKNITYDGEQSAIQTMQAGLTEMAMDVQGARDAHALGNDALAISWYRKSLSVLEDTLLPASQKLEQINHAQLETTYAGQKASSWVFLALALGSGIATIAALLCVQIFLRGRFHRNFSPPLVAAILVAAALTTYTGVAFTLQSGHLRAAKQDSYDSVIALLEAKSNAYVANAAESRYLLDPAMAAKYEKTFVDESRRLVIFSNGMNYDQATSLAGAGQLVPKESFSGRLADELNNITFQGPEFVQRYGFGERDVATSTLKAWGVYMAADQKIRALETNGHHAEAIAFCLSFKPGDSNWAFAQFDAALDKTLSINIGEMQRNTGLAFADLALMPYLPPLACFLIAILIYSSLRPRLREFEI